MNQQNIALFEAFKRLDGLCRDMYQSEKGVTEYINDMQARGGATFRIPHWTEDLDRLKRLRHIRNQLAHEISSFDEELCTEADVQWLKEFYQRVLDGKDPLSLLVKSEQERNKTGQHKNQKAPVQKKAKSNEQGCYIATCVYGSYDCPPVWTLRRFRDETLSTTWYGRMFIKLYYAVSPTLVKYFGKAEAFKVVGRKVLDRMVMRLRRKGYDALPYQDREA